MKKYSFASSGSGMQRTVKKLIIFVTHRCLYMHKYMKIELVESIILCLYLYGYRKE